MTFALKVEDGGFDDGFGKLGYTRLCSEVFLEEEKKPKVLYKKSFALYNRSTESNKIIFCTNAYYGVEITYEWDFSTYAQRGMKTELVAVLTEEEYLFKKLTGEIDDDGYANN